MGMWMGSITETQETDGIVAPSRLPRRVPIPRKKNVKAKFYMFKAAGYRVTVVDSSLFVALTIDNNLFDHHYYRKRRNLNSLQGG